MTITTKRRLKSGRVVVRKVECSTLEERERINDRLMLDYCARNPASGSWVLTACGSAHSVPAEA